MAHPGRWPSGERDEAQHSVPILSERGTKRNAVICD